MMDGELRNLLDDLKGGRITRRDFVQKGVALGFTVSSLGLILHNAAPALAASPRHAPGVRRGGTFRATIDGPSGGLDPALQQDDATIGICHNIYNFLVRINQNLVPYPDLATTWHSSPDGTVWTFPLRKGVTFHSGKAFTADDVIYTVKRLQNPKTASAAASNLSGISHMERVDDHTVRFHLKAANPDFPVLMADYHMCIIENNFKGNFSKNPSGTGPFMLKEFIPADHSTIVRNPHYWEMGYPYVDAVKFIYLPQPSTQIAAVQSGQADFTITVPPALAAKAVGSPGVRVVSLSGTGFLNMRMRSDRKPFNDPRVRQAMKYVVDRKGIRTVVNKGFGALGNDQPISPGYTRWYTDIGARPRDVAKAKSLLSAAGYTSSNPLSVKLYASPFANQTDFAVAYQQLASEAGINVSINNEPWANYLAKDWLEVDFGITSWSTRPTPTEFLNLLYKTGGVWNEAHYSNKQLDALIDKANSELEPTKRKAYYKQIEQLISDDGPSILPFYSVQVSVLRNRVQNMAVLPDNFHYYKAVWLST